MVAARHSFAALLVVACSSSSPTPPPPEPAIDDGKPEPAQVGHGPGFAWRPGEFELRKRSRKVLADGTIRETTSNEQRMVVREEDGHIVVTFPEQPKPRADAMDIALANASGLLRLELRADGRIDKITGYDAFLEAAAGYPGAAAMFSATIGDMRPMVEDTLKQSYLMWVVLWLDIGGIPKPGAPIERRDGDLVTRASAEDASASGPGMLRARFSIEGPVSRILETEHAARLQSAGLFSWDLAALFYDATGYWHVEVVTDPNNMILVTATTETRLTASTGGRTLTETATETTEFVPVTR